MNLVCKRNIKIMYAALLAICAVIYLLTANLYAEDIAVIVNEKGPLTDISTADIKEIYLGNIKLIKNIPIMPINYKESPVKDSFISYFIGMDTKGYRKYWINKVLKERDKSPVNQDDPKLTIKLVKNIEGAIGYVTISTLNETSGIKIISTIK